MSTKHTPGPWIGGQLRTKGAVPQCDGIDIGAESGANVAIALHKDGDRTAAETRANARLITAAPALLEALVYIRACIEADVKPGMNRANAAIAQATGEDA